MAKVITDEKIKLSIVIDGNVAQKELGELENQIRDLNSRQKELRLEKQLLEKQGLKDTERYKAVTASIKENSLAITANKTRMSELQKEVGITGLTLGQLQARAIALKTVLRGMIPSTENYKTTKAELTQVSDRIADLTGKAKNAKFSIGSMADSFNRYQGLAISAIAATTGLVLSIQKIIDINGKLSDAQADVMKTTGMTKTEVDELTKSFGMLETRTSRIDLLKIAEQGGRLGIPKAEIQDFVKSMNIAAVALGDSFTGGVDEVAEKLGKIKFLFKETKDMNVEDAYMAIGSAINDLGANGTASEANIAEFTKRIGSLTDVLKPTVQETLALGTAFEESGIEAETSSRAYNIFMKQASTEAGKFSKVMGISTKSVEDMINTNPLNFMLEFSKGLNGMNATEVAKTLDYLGVNADGANKVIGAMGNNFNRFHELIDLSNNSFQNGTSLIQEYNVKNENLAATLEKISKRISGFFSSESFINWLGGAVTWFAKFIGAAEDADGTITAFRNTLAFTAKVIGIVTAALLTNAGWQKLVALWTTRNTEATLLYTIAAKARAFADGVAMVASQAYAAVTMLLTGNIKGAIQAFRVMTATMMTTPWGFILGAVAAIGTAYMIFSKEAKAAATAQSMMADTANKTNALVEKESQTFMSLLKIIQDTSASTEARTEALKKAKEIGGEYVQGLTLENATTLDGKKMIDLYIQSLERKMQLQVLEAKQRELLEQIQDRKNKKLDEEVGIWDTIWSLTKNLGNSSNAATDVVITASQRKSEALKELQGQLNLTNAEMTAFLEKNPNLIKTIGTDTTSNFNVPGDKADGDNKKNPNSTAEELLKLRLDNERRFADESLKVQRQIEDDKIALMQDGYEKENAIEALRYKREIDDLNRQKVNAVEMAKLDEDIAKAKEAKDTTKYNALLNIKKFWEQKNIDLDAKMQELTEGKFAIHQMKLGTIQEKGTKTQIEKEKEAFDRAKVIRETKFQEQLAALGNNQKAKDKLTEEFNNNELLIEQKFLEDLIKKLNDIVGKGNFDKIDLDLLTPEQVEEFKKLAEKAGLALANLKNQKNSLTAGTELSDAQALGIDTSVDILGFSPDNWKQFYDNVKKGEIGINEMAVAVQALTNMYAQYSSFLAANEARQLKSFERNTEVKKRRLKQQLDSGIINQRQYKVGLEKLDEDLEKKKANIAYKQARREKQIAIMSAISGTAMAVVGALGNRPWTPFNFALAGIVGAMGLLQLGTIIAAPLPSKGAEKGLYNPEYVKREQDGKVFRNSGTQRMRTGFFNRPTLLVGEAGGSMPEMVIDDKSFARIHPDVKQALINELNGVRGFEQGYYSDKAMRYEVPATSSPSAPSSNNSDVLLQMAVSALDRNSAVMEDIVKFGITAVVKRNDTRSMDEIRKGIDEATKLRNKARK